MRKQKENLTNLRRELKYKIRVFSDMEDMELAKNWKRIVEENDYFPQSAYGWCAPWWQRISGKLKLHIIAIYDESDVAVCIAPLCIDDRMGLRSLRSFPVHFGDFYTLLIVKDERYEMVVNILNEYISSFSQWDAVRLDNVNSDDKLIKNLECFGYIPKELTKVVIVDFEGKTFDEYLLSLSANRRKDLTKKARRLERDKKIKLVKVDNYQGYLANIEKMKEMYDERWADNTMLLTKNYYECRNQAVKACFDDGKLLLYILEADDIPIAYHLGFTVNRTYYTWKEGHSPVYAYYSPGALIKYYFIKDLILSGFLSVNFMAGDYEFKRTMAKVGRQTTNYSMILASPTIRGWIIFHYYMYWRDLAKLYYKKILSYKFAKKVLRRKI